MLEFNKRVLQFKFDGEVQQLAYPTVKQIKELQELQEKEKNEVVVLEKFLIDLGMKKEVFDQLEVSSVNKIVEALVEQKK